jgi:phosphomannomutase
VLKTRKGAIVVNMSTSRMNEDLAKAADCPFHRSKVGEANVVEMIRNTNAAIGGEGNGGVIDPQVGWVRDPFVGMAYLLAALAETGQPLSELVATLPSYAMLKTKCTVERTALPSALSRLKGHWPGTIVNELDGLRLDGPNWWLHVRSSNTEPIVRIIAEAASESQAKQLCDEAANVIANS